MINNIEFVCRQFDTFGLNPASRLNIGTNIGVNIYTDSFLLTLIPIIMKKSIFIAVVFSAILVACDQPETENLAEKLAEVEVEKNLKNDKVEKLLIELNYIANNLQTIREKQGVYTTLTTDSEQPEWDSNPEAKIKEEIEMIDYLMNNNLDRIADLEKELSNEQAGSSELSKLVANFKKEVAYQAEQISALQNDLLASETAYSRLLDDHMNTQLFVELQEKQLALNDVEINQVFFALGSKNELLENQIIEKKGGVLGVGSAKVLSGDFDQSYFTSADLRQLDEIPLNVKDADILTVHPSGSYELIKSQNEEIVSIAIKNKELFWASSPYLVIMTKG